MKKVQIWLKAYKGNSQRRSTSLGIRISRDDVIEHLPKHPCTIGFILDRGYGDPEVVFSSLPSSYEKYSNVSFVFPAGRPRRIFRRWLRRYGGGIDWQTYHPHQYQADLIVYNDKLVFFFVPRKDS